MTPQQRITLVSACFYILAIFCGAGVIRYSTQQSYHMKHAAELSGFMNKVLAIPKDSTNTALKWGLSWLLRDPPQIGHDGYSEAVTIAARNSRESLVRAAILAAATAIFVAFLRLGVLNSVPDGTLIAVRHLCWTSLVLFVVGVGATALSLIAFRDMPVIGQVVFKFESKGIAQTILKLFSTRHFVLGLLIFLFSIAVPVVKVGLTLFATYTDGPKQDTSMKIIKTVGKWSMADVFVIAVLLAFFAIGGDEFTDADVGPGVYFFAAYCILSMWAGVWLACDRKHALSVR